MSFIITLGTLSFPMGSCRQCGSWSAWRWFTEARLSISRVSAALAFYSSTWFRVIQVQHRHSSTASFRHWCWTRSDRMNHRCWCSCSLSRKEQTADAIKCFRPADSNPELSVGAFCVTRPNQTHHLTDPTQPNPTHYKWKKFAPNQTQQNTNCRWLTLSLYYSFWSVSSTCQIGHKIKFNCLVQQNLI